MCAAFAAAPDLRAFKSGWLTPAQALAINSDAATLARFAQKLPKAELHIHIEGKEKQRSLGCPVLLPLFLLTHTLFSHVRVPLFVLRKRFFRA